MCVPHCDLGHTHTPYELTSFSNSGLNKMHFHILLPPLVVSYLSPLHSVSLGKTLVTMYSTDFAPH